MEHHSRLKGVQAQDIGLQVPLQTGNQVEGPGRGRRSYCSLSNWLCLM